MPSLLAKPNARLIALELSLEHVSVGPVMPACHVTLRLREPTNITHLDFSLDTTQGKLQTF